MSSLSIAHVFLGTVALLLGLALFALRKGSARHRVLGWIYVVCMASSLVTILFSTREHPAPFATYAAFMLGALAVATGAPRLRDRIPAWRMWHGALMSLSMLGAVVAVGGVAVGGVYVAFGLAPTSYYPVFDFVILALTAAGLTLIHRRPVIWGHNVAADRRRARAWFNSIVVTVTIVVATIQLRR